MKENSWDFPTVQFRTIRELYACDWGRVDPGQQNERPPGRFYWRYRSARKGEILKRSILVMTYMKVFLDLFPCHWVFLTESVKWDNKMCFNSCECVRVYLKWRSDGQECVTGPVNLLDSITHMHTDVHRQHRRPGEEKAINVVGSFF